MTLDYRDEIRSDIAHEFGLEALGYGLPKPKLPIQVAQRIICKYPVDNALELKREKLNPRATLIAKRYVAIFGRYL
jgi:hypothetical protein